MSKFNCIGPVYIDIGEVNALRQEEHWRDHQKWREERMVQQRREGEGMPPATKPAIATYRPLPGKLVVYILQASNQTEGGLTLPETMREKWVTTRVKIIAVGEGVKIAKVGDVGLVGINQQPDYIRHRGQVTLVLDENQLYGIEIPEQVEPK